jgi:signal transduction histidine kinase
MWTRGVPVLGSSLMRKERPLGTLVPVVTLALLLGGLAVMQYRWLSELAAADLTRTRASARDRARQLSAAFDREITRAFAKVGLPAAAPESRPTFATAWQEWRTSAPWPDLVSAVYLVETGTGTLQRFDPASGFTPTAWPPELATLQERLRRSEDQKHGEGRGGALHAVEAEAAAIPALLVPVMPGPGRPSPGGPGPRMSGPIVLVVLDRNVIASQVFPALESRIFDPRDGFDYVVRVTDGHNADLRFYESPGGMPGWRAEVNTGIFDVRLDAENRDLIDPRRLGPEPRRGPPPGRAGRGRREPPGRWNLEVANRLQPFEAMVAANRRRNLFVSFGVLGLLGASALMLVASARRAQSLAQQQMEFVAGVSHELQSPLAVMTSAAENLADGVVRDPEQVRRYGSTLRTEARRLSALVDQVLGYVGTYSGAVALEQEPVDVKSLVQDTLGALAAPLDDAGMSVEVAVPEEIPPLKGNGAALRRCLGNLVHNAIKYRGSSSALLITASEEAARGGRRVALTVSDRGVGFAPDEASRLFEPFFRGQAARAAQTPGTGLGLAVVRRTVEALGGTVEAAPRGGGGSVFTLRLPAIEQGAA